MTEAEETWAERVERLAMPKWRVGFFVVVEVNGFDEGEAAIIAECAARWPITRHDDPIPVDGWLNRFHVTGDIIRAEALMVKPA